MPTYLMLTNLTAEGVRTLKNNPSRVAEVNKELSLDGYTLAASVGVAWSAGSDTTAETLLGQARGSLARAKTPR